MKITEIENRVKELIKTFNEETFIYDFLTAYKLPKSSITRIKKGNLNMSKNTGEILWKKKLYFREEYNEDLHLKITDIKNNLKHKERFVIVTDYHTFLAVDTKTSETLDIDFKDLPKHYDFFLPWAGMEKASHITENPADVKAAERMAKLFDSIRKDNPQDDPDFRHGLNVFLSRLLFCYFAEDTGIFKKNQFTNAIDSHTQKDGSDLKKFLETLFHVLNLPENRRIDYPQFFRDFPYVNGGLFKDKFPVPDFTRLSRKTIIDNGDNNWENINPDIFGSMFQAVIDAEKRGNLGQHYTSVPNIMKVIKPLFLDELEEEFEKAKGSKKKLDNLINRIKKIKIFDPACGSGNFLIIAYKELRSLEMRIFDELDEIPYSEIKLSQFYGIEIDDFACEIAQLSLWLAEHQMNIESQKRYNKTNPTLPLKETGNIVCANACRIDWETVCPKNKGDETYILGNPPYLGARLQDKTQKDDIDFVLESFKNRRNLDYITCWFKKGIDYICKIDNSLAFVTTNSICQGEQVPIFWTYLSEKNTEIYFVHQSFKWENNAKGNAGVTVVIVGITSKKKKAKYMINAERRVEVKEVNAYLVEGSNIFIQKRSRPLSKLPSMCFGSMPNDGGNLIFDEVSEFTEYLSNEEIESFIRVMYGGKDYINGKKRYCLWLKMSNIEDAQCNELINKRVAEVYKHRINSKRQSTRELAKFPYRFGEIRHEETESIIVPRHSSERREYIPLGYLSEKCIICDSAQAVYNAELYVFGILTSRMHMTWMRTVAGRLKTDYRYSSTLVYNTFPFPKIFDSQKEEITRTAFRILDEREKHPDKTLAQLYDPDKMPEGLREAHRLNDIVIEKCYRSKPFENDEERLEYLFKLYERMIKEEENSLF